MKNFTNNAILYTKDNYDLLNKIKNICKNTNLNLFCEIDFFNLVQKIVKVKPKFIFIDEETKNLNIFPFEIIKDSIFKKQTKIIILSDNYVCNNNLIEVISINKLENFIINSKCYYIECTTNLKNHTNEINEMLLKIGFKPNLKGKDYLKDCINLVVEDKVNFSCLSKNCYPVVASIYKTNIVNLDRDIRTAINWAYKNRDEKLWIDFFKYPFNKKPTCKTFISLCAEKIKEYINN